MTPVLLGIAALAATYAVLRFDGTVVPRRAHHGYVAVMISVAAVGAAVGLAILALLLLFGVLLFAGAYAKVVLDPGLSERPPSAQERRRGYLALGISLGALAGIVLIWVSLR